MSEELYELYEKLDKQIKVQMLKVIKQYMNNCKGSKNDKLLSLSFGFLGNMEDLRDNFGGEIDLEEHPALVQALKNGIDLGEAFWVVLTDAICIYDFDSEYPEYDEFLNAVENRYNLEVA